MVSKIPNVVIVLMIKVALALGGLTCQVGSLPDKDIQHTVDSN